MSKIGKLYLESEREEIAFNNSQYETKKSFLDYTIRDVLTFIGTALAGIFVILVFWFLLILGAVW